MRYYIKGDRFYIREGDIPIPEDIKEWWSERDAAGNYWFDEAKRPVCRIVAMPNINDWRLVKREAMRTMGADSYTEYKSPTKKWKHSILKARHSPIRLLNYVVEFDNIPYCYAMHLVRHVHATPFVSSQRPDHQLGERLNDYGRQFEEWDRLELPQGALINFTLSFNAEELMVIAEKRLCNKASPFTRFMVRTMCTMIEDDEKAYIGLFGPRCLKGERCIEMKPCGEWRPGKVMDNNE